MADMVIDEGTILGCRPDKNQRRNSQYFADVLNLAPVEDGLKQLPIFTKPWTTPSITITHPNPRAFLYARDALNTANAMYHLVAATALYKIPGNSTTATQITTYNPASPGSTKAITSGYGWDYAALGDCYFLTNASNLVWYIPSNTDGKTFVTNGSFACHCLANHQTRLVIGGPNGTTSNTNWSAIFDTWRDASPTKEFVVTDENSALGRAWIMWSHQGGGDVDVPYVALMAALGLPTQTMADKFHEYIVQSIETGEMGMLPLEHTGDVVHLLPLGDDLIAYGNAGISRLVFTEFGYQEVPLLDLGLDGRLAADGDEVAHAFVAGGQVYTLDLVNGLKRRKYEEFVGDLMTGGNIIVSFEPEQRWWFITDGVKGAVLTHTGFARTELMPTSVLPGYKGVATALTSSNKAIAQTCILDGGSRRVWEIPFVKLATTDLDPTGWKARVDWRFNKDASFTNGTLAAVDDRGIGRVKTSGTEFQIYLEASDHSKVDLEYLEVQFAEGRKRSLRKLVDA